MTRLQQTQLEPGTLGRSHENEWVLAAYFSQSRPNRRRLSRRDRREALMELVKRRGDWTTTTSPECDKAWDAMAPLTEDGALEVGNGANHFATACSAPNQLYTSTTTS